MKASEFKFKAWDRSEKEFIDPRGIEPNMPVANTKLGFKFKSVYEFFQFTGYKDSNNKDIYCGDIIEVNFHDTKIQFEVMFKLGGFVIETEIGSEDGLHLIGSAIEEWSQMEVEYVVIGHVKNKKIK